MATGGQSEAGGLTRTEIEAITARLQAGQYLDDHYRSKLFRQPKEAELVYGAKEGRSSVLSRTMAVPLQVLKRFGGAEGGWANKLVFGDNLQVLKTLLELKERGELRNADGTPGVRLCYIDPPFATKREFRTSKGQLAYRDKVEGAEFVEFLRKRLVFIHELLADDGVLYLHLDTNKVHYMKVLLDEIFGPQSFRTEIIWKRSSAHSDTKQGRAQHGRIHDTILFYSKGQSWVWNPLYTPYEPAYLQTKYRYVEPTTGRRYRLGDLTGRGGASKGNPVYDVMGVTRPWAFAKDKMDELIADGRIVQTKPGGVPQYKRYLDEMEGVPLQDVWADLPPVNPMARDRLGYPTQKPLTLLERIIESSSNEGDLVLDCFAGSGTTAVAAEKLGRRWIGVDCGKLATYVTQRRLLALTEKNGKQPTLEELAPFEVCSAGLYDNELLEQLPYERYEEFCLQLFGCRRQPHEISGVRFAATRKGAPVHCFPFRETDAQMGRTYIESLHDRIGSKVTGPVYVIAPVSACDPGLFEDVITLDQNAYFVLRVPYSVIEALHGRNFELPLQPDSMDQLNDALDSYGFDFLEVPEVATSYERSDGVLRVVVDGFSRGGLDPDDFGDLEDGGRADLAMVLIDSHYDAETFNLTESRFGAELRDAGWTFDVALDDPSARVCLIYMDVHGNELREVIDAGNGSGTREPTAGVGLAAPGRREVEA
jgi:site-specific DNA-methyltransferase (adenine-specific)/adenine-specific DNA-methyltransferase